MVGNRDKIHTGGAVDDCIIFRTQQLLLSATAGVTAVQVQITAERTEFEPFMADSISMEGVKYPLSDTDAENTLAFPPGNNILYA